MDKHHPIFGAVNRQFIVDRLLVNVYENRQLLGEAAGHCAAEIIRETIYLKGHARIIFAAAPSQDEMLATIVQSPDIDWSKVTAFHMDEYIGLPENSPERFSSYLKHHIFERVPFGNVHYLINDSTNNPDDLVLKYQEMIQEKPIDLICMGIGENGHIAFNDPHVADFNDVKKVKIVALDERCRQQQVNDGCFRTLSDVPKTAMTITIPVFMSASTIVCAVPGMLKRLAVRHALRGEISPKCPASILRRHSNACLFVDQDSCDV